MFEARSRNRAMPSRLQVSGPPPASSLWPRVCRHRLVVLWRLPVHMHSFSLIVVTQRAANVNVKWLRILLTQAQVEGALRGAGVRFAVEVIDAASGYSIDIVAFPRAPPPDPLPARFGSARPAESRPAPAPADAGEFRGVPDYGKAAWRGGVAVSRASVC